jgi:hypothetical protein
MHGPTCIFWANLTHFSLRATATCGDVELGLVRVELEVEMELQMGLGLIH